jgi:formate/nitrite transporter FocA (FNT family)
MAEQASDSPHLEQAEKDQADDHAPLRPLVIHEIIRAEGNAELQRPAAALLWSGLAAGMSMGFSFVAQALLKTDIPAGPGAHALASAGYMVGFIIVVLGRQQLFTESTLTAVLPALHNGDARTWVSTFRLWNIVFAANIVGTWLFAAVLALGHPLPAEAAPALTQLAAETLSHPFWNTLLRAVLAGWLIALMVWLLPSAGTARILIIALLTWLVAFAKLSHVIAGSAESAYAVLTGGAPWTAYVVRFLIPTLIGNTIGGVALVAMLNHAPLSADAEEANAE